MGELAALSYPGLPVPDQLTRDRAELLDQVSRPEQQILRLPCREHSRRYELGVRRHDHHHRQHDGFAVLERDPPRREPEITLRRITRRPRHPVRQVDPAMLPRRRLTSSRNQVIDRPHSTRCANSVANIVGCSASSARTRASNGEKTSPPAGAQASAYDPSAPPQPPSLARCPDPESPDAAEHHLQRAA